MHGDQLGRPQAVTNGGKATVWWAYGEAFDRHVTLDNIGGLNIGLPGQYYDAETGYWNNGFRDYDSGIGRHILSLPSISVSHSRDYAARFSRAASQACSNCIGLT